MRTEIETAIRATHCWIMIRFYGAALPASLSAAYDEAEGAFAMLAEAAPRERARLTRQGFGVETLKGLQLAIEDAGLWPAYAKDARPFTGRAYDLDEGLALASAL
ncbi:hypothetical protein HNR00_003574 [Methylorubrum rhodinum]|uniref:Uncharacterized protein n=1 Tax=Methylorubrum rhodinum TaxID=29428 RepID=A0A840ZPQ1_9HYPH|nr:hypothetical protein [Methylorubrum rhodinum]MBB5758847.1 hypothetical protein [Methylorubrum rhodinum]